METAYDSDVSEAYVDANEDVPMPASSTNATAAIPSSSSTRTNHLRPPLPDWQEEESSSLPCSVAESLTPNANSPWVASEHASFPVDDVPPSLPPHWVQIVAGDVARMANGRPTGSSSQSSSPTLTSAEEVENLGDMNPSLCRLSDAYIAGMPAKRRRVFFVVLYALLSTHTGVTSIFSPSRRSC